MEKMGIIAITLAIILIVAIVLFIGTGTAPQPTQPITGATSPLAVQLTDPPQVPNGTSALVIGYSSLQVHAANPAGQSAWLESNGSGTIDLLSLLNFSQTIGAVALPVNSTVDSVRFNITSAKITINGTTYNVTVPSGTVQANLKGTGLSANNSAVMLSLSPTIVSILTANSTVFVMVPSVRAVVVPQGTTQATVAVGYKTQLSVQAHAELERSKPNVSIAPDASLSYANNSTEMRVTVSDNSNRSVTLNHIVIYGNISTQLNNTFVYNNTIRIEAELRDRLQGIPSCNLTNAITNVSSAPMIPASTSGLNSTLGGNSTSNVQIRAPEGIVGADIHASEKGGNGTGSNVTAGADLGRNATSDTGSNATANATARGESNTEKGNVNESSNTAVNATAGEHEFGDINATYSHNFNISINSSVCSSDGLLAFRNRLNARLMNITAEMEHEQARYKLITLFIGKNGTISIPSTVEDVADTAGIGYTIPAGGSATFTFGGELRMGQSGLTVHPTTGETYRIAVSGENDAYASINVTAS